jgi:hypothetical protein
LPSMPPMGEMLCIKLMGDRVSHRPQQQLFVQTLVIDDEYADMFELVGIEASFDPRFRQDTDGNKNAVYPPPPFKVVEVVGFKF